MAVDVQASSFELEIRVAIRRTQYVFYLWSNTQTLISSREERGG